MLVFGAFNLVRIILCSRPIATIATSLLVALWDGSEFYFAAAETVFTSSCVHSLLIR